MADPHNPTIHPTLKVVFIGADGAGGFYLRTTSQGGDHAVYPLDLERAVRLQVHLAQAIRELAIVTRRPPG